MRRKYPIDVWEFVDKRGPNDCWLWTGYRTHPLDGNGYGYMVISQRGYIAHRIVYYLTHPGEITLEAPQDKSIKEFVLHKCDNRLCCNPDHLFLGNYDDNNKDAAKKGRTARDNGVKGTQNYASKLTANHVKEIRWLASKGLANSEIEKLYPISNEAVRRVVKHISYKEV